LGQVIDGSDDDEDDDEEDTEFDESANDVNNKK